MAEQYALPERVIEDLSRRNIPYATLAAFSDLSRSMTTQYLGGQKGLSLGAQIAVLRAMRFFEAVAKGSAAPVDFGNVEALRPLWREFVRAENEAELARLESA